MVAAVTAGTEVGAGSLPDCLPLVLHIAAWTMRQLLGLTVGFYQQWLCSQRSGRLVWKLSPGANKCVASCSNNTKEDEQKNHAGVVNRDLDVSYPCHTSLVIS